MPSLALDMGNQGWKCIHCIPPYPSAPYDILYYDCIMYPNPKSLAPGNQSLVVRL